LTLIIVVVEAVSVSFGLRGKMFVLFSRYCAIIKLDHSLGNSIKSMHLYCCS